MKKNIFLSAVFFCQLVNTCAQDTASVKFFDFITADSVVMYFDNRYNFTGEECARYRRFTRLDTAGNFTGAFTDYEEGRIIAKGHYINGIKEGLFETFYRGGEIKSRGSFKNNRPSGYWYYFYAGGKTEKQLLFNVVDTLLLEYYDLKGHHLVQGGNGHYEGMVGVATDPYYSTLAIAAGEVVNGKADGVWTTRLGGGPAYTETFARGVFISGKAPKRLVKDKEEYNDLSYLDILYQPAYIYRLEEFNLEKCDADYTAFLKNRKQGKGKEGGYTSFESLRSYVQDAVQNVLRSDMRNGNSADYQAGENLFKLSFKISEKGSPVDFKRITSWGDQFFNPVTNAISLHLKSPAVNEVLYFVLTITKDASDYLTSHFYFTRGQND